MYRTSIDDFCFSDQEVVHIAVKLFVISIGEFCQLLVMFAAHEFRIGVMPMVTTRPAQRIDPCDRIWGVLIKVDSTHQVNGVGCRKAAYIGIIKPERIEIQACFPIQVLIEINYHVHV
ncbi:hypothetical protein ASE80_11400 [Pseudomonas sp. Leaf15]|nr:hypothetical protein ASE80_11400 [Pseudomonas sp. Leaf15]